MMFDDIVSFPGTAKMAQMPYLFEELLSTIITTLVISSGDLRDWASVTAT